MSCLSLLLLQGPASPFLKDVASCIEHFGGQVHKINFSAGDAIFFAPRRGKWFLGRDDEWPSFLRTYIKTHAITDILMLGDGRPKHAAAIEVARELGVTPHVFEHGYLRPDWLTIEPYGMSSASLFPDRPSKIEALAKSAPVVPAHAPFRYSFLTYALVDLTYHLPNVALGWLLHPRYRAHGAVHPLVEYAGWISKALTYRRRRRRALEIEQRFLSGTGPLYLMPLQLPGDYQIRRHAPIGNHFKIVEAIIRSFSKDAPQDARLLFKIHPIDNGLSRWEERVGEIAEVCGVTERVAVIDGGNLDSLMMAASGIVTVNSTVGLTALLAGRPVITLGAAIYDIEGLTAQTTLSEFWRTLPPPDPALAAAFQAALTATVQVPGGFIGKEARRWGARGIVQRILAKRDWLDEGAKQRRRIFRHETELKSLLRDAETEDQAREERPNHQ